MAESRVILANYDENTIRVYQAYSNKIADEAVNLGKFGQTFKKERTTWIKPSFLWMMYRSGWATKENQERILAIDLLREGFDLILKNAVLSSFEERVYKTHQQWKQRLQEAEVRCQWDPDRDIYGNPLNRRAIQIGISGRMVIHYINEWIKNISDITDKVTKMRSDINQNNFNFDDLPDEKEYSVENP